MAACTAVTQTDNQLIILRSVFNLHQQTDGTLQAGKPTNALYTLSSSDATDTVLLLMEFDVSIAQ